MNMPTLVVLGILIVAVVFAIRRVKKNGSCSCGNNDCGCSSCPSKTK